jgi:acetyl esterase/lipase
MCRCFLLTLIALTFFVPVFAQSQPEVRPLWPADSPQLADTSPEDAPELTIYLPPENEATGAAIVICPGGGYVNLAMNHEGHDVARWLNSIGVAAIIVSYRRGDNYPHPAPITDAREAIRTVRANATTWGIDPERVGILGFSAGGHLAASTGIYHDPAEAGQDVPRPNFMILGYPVISMTESYMHKGSRNHLIGEPLDEALAWRMSHEKNVTPDVPPTFLVHTTDDQAVPVENSIYLYMQMRKAGVPVEMHIYETGRHGLGLGPDDPSFSNWPLECEAWMRKRGLLDQD